MSTIKVLHEERDWQVVRAYGEIYVDHTKGETRHVAAYGQSFQVECGECGKKIPRNMMLLAMLLSM